MISMAEIAVFLLAAVVFVPLFRWLKLSSILGYVVAGLVIGPWGLGLVTEVDNILKTSEFGVVLLMFVIGLELQPSRLWVLRHAVFEVGAAQVLLCAVLIGGAAWLAGMTLTAALVIGIGLSLSSTALVLQVLAERGQLTSNHGRAAFGILLFQDIAVLPVLAVLPLLARGGAPSTAPLLALGKLLAVMVLVVVAGRVLLRPLLRLIARIKVTEVFTAATLLIVISVSLLVNAVGLSMSLGAFLAGVLLADSEFRHELEADIEPFKGLLLGLFFIAVGMSANLPILAQQPLRFLAITLAFMTLKFVGIVVVGKLSRLPRDAAWRLAVSMVTGGEFAFVLFGLASRQGLLNQQVSDLLILAVTCSMILAPLMLSAYDAVSRRWYMPAETRPFDRVEQRGPVLIAGFGRFGQIVGRVLRARHIDFTALDNSPANIDFIRRFGAQVYYGDASRLEMLRAAGAERSSVFVLAIDDVEASVRTAQLVRHQFPDLTIFARARSRQHTFRLMELGVEHILRETYGSSLEMVVGVLESLGETTGNARQIVRRFREHDEETLRRQFAVRDDDTKMIATTQEATKQLESLFEADSALPEPE